MALFFTFRFQIDLEFFLVNAVRNASKFTFIPYGFAVVPISFIKKTLSQSYGIPP